MSYYKKEDTSVIPLIPIGVHKALPVRKISKEVCEFFDYTISNFAGEVVQVCNYRREGELVAQQLRFEGKRFKIAGQKDKMLLGGMDKYKSTDKVSVTLAEGAIDALSIAQIMGTNYPIVWLPRGVKECLNLMKKEEVYNYLNGFKEIVICFDSDLAGKEYAVKLAKMFGPKKVRILSIPKHDVNDMLVAGEGAEFSKAWWNAPFYAPSNTYELESLDLDDLFIEEKIGWSFPYPKINKMLLGIQQQCLYVIAAGSGLGKSTFLKEVGHHLITQHKLKIGCVFLEESRRKTLLSFYAIENNIAISTVLEGINNKTLDHTPIKEYLNKISDKVAGVNQFACNSTTDMLEKIEYLMVASNCDVVFLDHISMIVSGIADIDDRKTLDVFMTQLRALVQRCGKTVIAVVHLKRKEGVPYNEGGTVSLNDMRGTAAIEQTADVVIALERDQFAESEKQKQECMLKVLKNRETGEVAYADILSYSMETGRLLSKGVDFLSPTYEDDQNVIARILAKGETDVSPF